MLIVSVSITVSVHASVSASVSVSAAAITRALPPPSPQLLQLPFCSVIPGTGSLNNPLSPGAEKCHPEKNAQPSGRCTGTSRLSSTLPWPCTTSHRGTRKHPSQAEKHHKSKKARRIGLRLSSLRPESLPSSLSLPSSCQRVLQQTNHQKQ